MQTLTRTLSATVLAVAAIAGSVGAQAQTSTSSGMGSMGGYSFYAPGSGYIGLNVGQSHYTLGSGVGGYGSNSHDTVYNLYAGSYFSNNFGFEVGYTDFGKIGRAGGQTDAEGINLSLVGRAPIANSFNILGKLGTTYGRTHVSSAANSGINSGGESNWGISYGIGAEWAFAPQWSAVVQYDEHKLKFAGGDKDRIGATTVGLRYRF